MRKVRLVFAILILIVSISFLLWGFLPNSRETRIQTIRPTEMQLPTPSSLHLDLEPAA